MRYGMNIYQLHKVATAAVLVMPLSENRFCFAPRFAGYCQPELALQLMSLLVEFGLQLVIGFITEHCLEADPQFWVICRTPTSIFEIVGPIHVTENFCTAFVTKVAFQLLPDIYVRVGLPSSPTFRPKHCVNTKSTCPQIPKPPTRSKESSVFPVLVSVAHILYIIALTL